MSPKVHSRRQRIHLRPEVDQALRHLAVARGLPVSQVIAWAIEEVVTREGWLAPPASSDSPQNAVEGAPHGR